MSLETLFGPVSFVVLTQEERDARIEEELARIRHDENFYDGPIPSIHVLTPRQVLTAISDEGDELSQAAAE